jgi:hypothetical protein
MTRYEILEKALQHAEEMEIYFEGIVRGTRKFSPRLALWFRLRAMHLKMQALWSIF